MKQSRKIKRDLLTDLWDRFLKKEKEKASSVNKLKWSIDKALKKKVKAEL